MMKCMRIEDGKDRYSAAGENGSRVLCTLARGTKGGEKPTVLPI